MPNKRLPAMLRQYYSDEPAQYLLARPGVLALVCFDAPCRAPASMPLIATGLTRLSGPKLEVIEYLGETATRGIDGDCHWSYINDLACVATWISPRECENIALGTEQAYSRLLQWIHGAGFIHPLRIWNFLPNINQGAGDSEVYKQFCVGRERAFEASALAKQSYPAASALGHHGDGAVVYMLASRSPGRHHENPNQQPAYQYPRRYGPASPSFARATSIERLNRQHVLVSGTASILGHDTQGAGDLQQQLELTLYNIRNLLTSINARTNQLTAVRVYLRHARDLNAAHAYLSRHIAAEKLMYIHADVCRSNLDVEIEALATEPLP